MLIGMLAGEASGDILGADLIQALKRRYPQAKFVGIGGPKMIAQGFHSLFPMETLSVMGFIEPLKRLPQLLSIYFQVKKYFIQNKTTVFIGIDSPEFNLRLEHALKAKQIKTVHYVSPTVWAWRKNRIHHIKKSVDLMLTLFPFEIPIYQEHAIKAVCVGHPLADQIPFSSDKGTARKALGLPLDKKIVALLPGSRAQELKYMLKPFLDTAAWIQKRLPDTIFISACPNEQRMAEFQSQNSQVQLFMGQAQSVIAAADCVLIKSGTGTLETMLVKRPAVIAYKTSQITYAIAKWLIKVPFIGLPNLLAKKQVMPEFIQKEVVPEKMGPVLLEYLQHPPVMDEFETMHRMLKKNAGETAAAAICELIKE